MTFGFALFSVLLEFIIIFDGKLFIYQALDPVFTPNPITFPHIVNNI